MGKKPRIAKNVGSKHRINRKKLVVTRKVENECPFYVAKMAVIRVGNVMLKYGSLMVTMPDNQWHGEKMSKIKTISKYRIINFKMLHQVTPFTKDKKYIAIVECIMISTNSPQFKKEIGQKLEFNVEKFLCSKLEYQLLNERSVDRESIFGEIFRPPNHTSAEERSILFAKMVYERMNSQRDEKMKYPIVITLDGYGRNLYALLNAGIPEESIVILEQRPITAVYQQLMKMAMNWKINTIWTGSDQRKHLNGFQGYILNPRRLLKYDIGLEQVQFLYADFCGDVPKNLMTCLKKLPSLKILGITQGKRNCKSKDAIDDVAEKWSKHAEKRLSKLAHFDQHRVRCSFFTLV